MSARSVAAGRLGIDRLTDESRRAQTPMTAAEAELFQIKLRKLEREARTKLGPDFELVARFAPVPKDVLTDEEKIAREKKSARRKQCAKLQADLEAGADADETLARLDGVKDWHDLEKRVLAGLGNQQLLEHPAVKSAVAAAREDAAAAERQILELKATVERVEEDKNLQLSAARAELGEARVTRDAMAKRAVAIAGKARRAATAVRAKTRRALVLAGKARKTAAALRAARRGEAALEAQLRVTRVEAKFVRRKLSSAEALATEHGRHIARLYRVSLGEQKEWDALVANRDHCYEQWYAAEMAKRKLEETPAVLLGRVVGYGNDVQSACIRAAEVTRARMRLTAPYLLGCAVLSPLIIFIFLEAIAWLVGAFSPGGVF